MAMAIFLCRDDAEQTVSKSRRIAARSLHPISSEICCLNHPSNMLILDLLKGAFKNPMLHKFTRRFRSNGNCVFPAPGDSQSSLPHAIATVKGLHGGHPGTWGFCHFMGLPRNAMGIIQNGDQENYRKVDPNQNSWNLL